MQKIPKISQSLIKAYYDYVADKECGIFFQEKYINKNPKAVTPPSEAMEVGIYFEYLCTGALPRSGETPQPKLAYAGTAREKLSAPYERATESAEFFKKIVSHYDIKILEIGKVIEVGELNGIIDIYAEWNGKPCFIDLKYSGLYNDKWHEMGWELESLQFKDSLMIQAVHYKKLWELLGNGEIDFYFFVFDSANSQNAKIIKADIDESKMASQDIVVINTMNGIKANIEKGGFTPKPELERCNKCPLNNDCEYAVKYPLVHQVYY